MNGTRVQSPDTLNQIDEYIAAYNSAKQDGVYIQMTDSHTPGMAFFYRRNSICRSYGLIIKYPHHRVGNIHNIKVRRGGDFGKMPGGEIHIADLLAEDETLDGTTFQSDMQRAFGGILHDGADNGLAGGIEKVIADDDHGMSQSADPQQIALLDLHSSPHLTACRFFPGHFFR